MLDVVELRASHRRIAVMMQRAAPSSNLLSFVTCATQLCVLKMHELSSPLHRICGQKNL
jgi:hypothetical protein